MTSSSTLETALSYLLEEAKKNGADTADAIVSSSRALSVEQRLGTLESLQYSEETEVGLRVFCGKKTAIVSSSDFSPATLARIATEAVSMARAMPDDPYAGIAPESMIARTIPDLDLFDQAQPSVETLLDMTKRAEDAARSVSGVTNSSGCSAEASEDMTTYAATNGFMGTCRASGFHLSVSVIAGTGDDMQTDGDGDAAVFLSDLRAAEDIGHLAGMRAVKALHPRKGRAGKMPVIFDRRISNELLGVLASAISGRAVARGTTFLKDALGSQIFDKNVTVIDDPYLQRGARSRAFDGEGVAPSRRLIIDQGVLTGWFLDLATSRQLGLVTTGNATRGASSPPSPRPSNFYIQNGLLTPDDMIKDIQEGFWVTSLMGAGGNTVTGDYSTGAAGFWIENGEIAYPVNEMTIAGDLRDMWRLMTAANDLRLTEGIDAPTLRIEGMMIA